MGLHMASILVRPMIGALCTYVINVYLMHLRLKQHQIMSICIGNYIEIHLTIAGEEMTDIRTNGAILEQTTPFHHRTPKSSALPDSVYIKDHNVSYKYTNHERFIALESKSMRKIFLEECWV